MSSDKYHSSSPSTVAARSHQTADSPLLLELGESAGGLVVITIYPDEKGRFGFNVKGGADQKMPIIVSRVGANTPADRSVSRSARAARRAYPVTLRGP